MDSESRPKLVPVAVVLMAVSVAGAGWYLYDRSARRVNHETLEATPKRVSTVLAKPAKYQAHKRYIATVEPWIEAKIGPELASGYVSTVVDRPGTSVTKGEVVATLDCRSAAAANEAVRESGKAMEAKQAAIAREAERVHSMVEKGFVSENEAEKKLAESQSQQADILASRARLMGTSLEVDDCVLRSPFDGEINRRSLDPGAFVRPGGTILTIVQRDTVRVAIEVPEVEYSLFEPGSPVHIHLLALDRSLEAKVSRRSPGADEALRMLHVEVDVPNQDRTIPVGTSADVHVDVGTPADSAEVPLSAVAIRGENASFYVVENGVAKKASSKVLGEALGSAFLDARFASRPIVVEGRALLQDGDPVTAESAPEAGK